MGKKNKLKTKAIIPYTLAERSKRINDFFIQLSVVTSLEVPTECFKRLKEFEATGKEYIDKVQLDTYKQLDIHLTNDKNKPFYMKYMDNMVVIDDEDVRRLIE